MARSPWGKVPVLLALLPLVDRGVAYGNIIPEWQPRSGMAGVTPETDGGRPVYSDAQFLQSVSRKSGY